MLVLSRKRGEQIVIGSGPDAITLVVVEVQKNQIRLGVQAPKSVPILRAEMGPWNQDKRTKEKK